MSIINIQPAIRRNVKAMVLLSGPSGCGKTYSALELARGLVGPDGKIGFLDTEADRALHYADLTPFLHATMSPPFTPERHIEAINEFKKHGVDALIIDSVSLEWAGEGGVQDIADADDKAKGLQRWAKPKMRHKKFVNHLLQCRMHVIMCARATEKLVQVEQNGRKEIVSAGWHAIVEKNLPYEVLISAVLDEKTKVPAYTKRPEQLREIMADGQRIDRAMGARLNAWLNSGAEAANPILAIARDKAAEGMKALTEWRNSLTADDKRALVPIADELKSIAKSADAESAEAAA